MEKQEIDDLAESVGGRFRLTVLLQKRLRELARGAVPLVETESRNLIDIAMAEVRAGKVTYEGQDLEKEADEVARRMKGS